VKRAVSITLKIPDNTAYTALVALRRLGVDVDRIERSDIRFFEDHGDVPALQRRIQNDETIFNPNLHRIAVLDDPEPRSGEVWIVPENAEGSAIVAWRLFEANARPVDRAVLGAAVERLLCNPAIERAVIGGCDDRDNARASE